MKLLIENWKRYLEEEASPAAQGQKNMTLVVPKFRISEQWGTPGSQDRKIIELFTSKIKGSTLKEKISSLNGFVSECDAACAATKEVSEILANLVFLDSLASVIYDFNPMTGGFLFESLIAALLGGEAKQVETGSGADQDVTDVIDHNGRPLSLKFFFEGGSQYIHGSFWNLKRDIKRHNQPMVYLIGLKNRNHKDRKVLAIDFYEFTVGDNKEGIRGDYDVGDIGYGNGLPISYIIGAKPRGRPRRGEEGKPRQRFKKTSYYLGTLDFGDRDKMIEVAQSYANRLGSLMLEIYQQIDELSKNVNTYFLESPDAKDAAMAARANAETLKKDAEEL
tara:strand:- start:1021 stop:2025 length:1005 start_codon:yes stop_codon:yes gene_type:complete